MSAEGDKEEWGTTEPNRTNLDEQCCGNRTEDLLPDFNATLLDVNATPTAEIDSFYFYETEQFTVLWLLFAMIVVGNVAVLIGLLWGKRRKTRMDFFIKQLALADLLVGLISVLTDIIWRATVTWHAGNIACKLIRFMQTVVTYSSTYVLVALSIDRYDAITRPMNFTGRWWRARALVVAAWSLSALFSLPIIFLYEERAIQDGLPGEDSMLDRTGLPDAVEDLHEPGQRYHLYSSCADNRRVLCCDRSYYMVARRSVTSGAHQGHQKSVLQRTYSPSESQDGQDDPRHSVRIHPLLEPVHTVRPPSGLRVRAENADQHRRGYLHPELNALELRCQSDHILSLQHVVL
ncbi:cardioacceleratory peptide receptor isoform X2 [Hylaeus anthracinus]|uniref:cardioacceleratory peptide receptor isoform X2 n=1 Tax=Hylaeus volcanicus TaxID=313075 RepID=UPI0023B7D0B6|nr:cardioacceleratory peptide receptor isoform X2 [Hylaeus volcanicus]XP_054001289.1 cardioacceleratory peptide receptor isoform X2 [Hylaeus anthracinus]